MNKEKIKENLDVLNLKLLFEGKISAIYVSNFFPKALCSKISEWVLDREDIHNYDHELKKDGQTEYLTSSSR